MTRSALTSALARQARRRRDELAIWSRGEGLRLSFGDLSARIEAWRRALTLAPGETVGLAVGNRAAFCEIFFALRSAGHPVLAVDATGPAADAIALCRTLGAPWLLHAGPAGTRVAADVRLTATGARPELGPPAGTALVKVTSGSTGAPVGACFDEAALCAGITQIAAGMGLTEGDRVLLAIPLSHSYGFDNGVLSLALLGTPLILEPSHFPAPLLAAVEESEATVLPLVPPLVHGLSQVGWPRHRLRLVLSAGGSLAPPTADRFLARSGVPVHQFYGSTETGGISFESDPLAAEARGTVGRPLPGVVVALDGDGTVRVRSPANRTARLGPDPGSALPGEVRPGDRAVWTPEGRLRLVGRQAEILNVGGRKVAAARIEEALCALEGVDAAAVVGLEDAVRGDRIVAFVVSRRERIDPGELPRGLAPREIRRLPALPYTERGKLDRSKLRALAARGRSPRGEDGGRPSGS